MSQVRDGWSTTGTGGADQGTVRRANLSLVLRSLREGGARSRARLAADLGLNKATVSSLVTELRERGLVREGSAERGAVGRPGTIVEIDGAGAYGLGAEINVHHVSTRAVDLAGAVVSERRTSRGRPRPRARRGGRPARRAGPAARWPTWPRSARPRSRRSWEWRAWSTTTAAPSRSRPNLGWQRRRRSASLLRARLGDPDYLLEVDNEANLAAVAEAIPGDPERRDILVIFGEVGIGGGIVADGRPLRRTAGYAGEFGHMVVDPRRPPVRLRSHRVLGDRRRSAATSSSWPPPAPTTRSATPLIDLEGRLEEINRRADRRRRRGPWPRSSEVGRWVGIGAAILANALNPGVIVLSGYFAEIGRADPPRASRPQLAAGVLAPDAGGTRVALSTPRLHRRRARWRRRRHRPVFDDPTLVPRRGPHAGGDVMTDAPLLR